MYEESSHRSNGRHGSSVKKIWHNKTWPKVALATEPTSQNVFEAAPLRRQAFHADKWNLVFNTDVEEALTLMSDAKLKVDCIVTSPPFYGQRDYGVDGQIGLELHPREYIETLVRVFLKCAEVLKPTGSLWVNLGDTYWSGRGQHRSGEKKQSARRFGLRPQDRKGDGVWCRPKQLLLIPHRFAIAMQDAGWIVRNDNVWVKPNPIPDQVRDRCSMSHEYVFHFVRQRFYFFNRDAVGRPSNGKAKIPPLDTWSVPPTRGLNGHKAAFSEELVDTPIRATTPQGGVVLDPFAGSGTALVHAKREGFRSIGIDLKKEYCETICRSVLAETPGRQNERQTKTLFSTRKPEPRRAAAERRSKNA
jgi:site-specific DNA-methyltransferase (adenine-specific)